MPMLKTVKPGATTATHVRKYLERELRRGHGTLSEEITLLEEGCLHLAESHATLIASYLEGGSRALAIDVSEDLSKGNWDWQMNVTRTAYGHDRPTGKGASRAYHHFILSPAMEDDCDLDTLRAYAVAWTRANFRNGRKTHEYAIVYHDDNAKGVPHAHIIVNATDKATGKKLHTSNKEVVRLGNSAQEIGREFGLTPVRSDVEYRHIGVRTSQPIYLTRGERELLNEGKYSWKWELREIIWSTAGRSRDFGDFELKLRRRGYDVRPGEQTCIDEDAGLDESGKPIRKLEYEYLLYTHKNGKTARDESLGAKFYRESLEREFTREVSIDDRKCSSWEIIKISRGEIPWKEDIRRAIDQIAPTVLSIPELQEELERQFGIKFTVNRRGITYVHSSGFKARDVSLGLRYTAGGLRQNSVLGEMASPGEGGPKKSGLYREFVRLMERTGSITLDDMARTLGDRHRKVMEEKGELAEMKRELGELNRLVLIQSRYEQDRAFLEGGRIGADSGLYEGALVRFEHTGRYLRDRAGDGDLMARQKELRERYDERLSEYQEHLDDLGRDQAVYDGYLEARGDGSVPARALFDVSRTLSRYRIDSYHQLDQVIFRMERKELIAERRFNEADRDARRLQAVLSDIRSCRDAEENLSSSGMLLEGGSPLSREVHQVRLKDARARLDAAGIEERDYGKQEELYERARQKRFDLKREFDAISATVRELKEAKSTCEGLQRHYVSLLERMIGEVKKGGSSSAGGTARSVSEQPGQAKQETRKPLEPLPFDEAKRRSQKLEHKKVEEPKLHPILGKRGMEH